MSSLSKFAHFKYTINHQAFNFASLEACYWAGFIATDGHIQQCKNKSDKLVIEIAKQDQLHLEKLKKFLQYTGPIRYYKNGAILSVSSQEICEDLYNNFNILKGNKTFKIGGPKKMRRNQNLAFLKGAIDGDGGVYNDDKIILYIGNVAPKFIKWCAKIMSTNAKFNGELPRAIVHGRIPKSTNYCLYPSKIYTYRIAGKFANVLYKKIMNLKCPTLERKWLDSGILQYV